MTRQFVHGFKEADKLLAQLPQNIEHRVLQKATKEAAKEIKKEAIKAAPRSRGKQSKASKKYKKLFKNIRIVISKVARKKGRRGARIDTGDGFWGLFLEFGTVHMAARPWFRPAIERSKNNAIKVLKTELGKGIEKEATKLARANRVK